MRKKATYEEISIECAKHALRFLHYIATFHNLNPSELYEVKKFIHIISSYNKALKNYKRSNHMNWKEKFFDMLNKLDKPYQLVKMNTSCRSIENDGWFEKEYGILFENEENPHWLGYETTHNEDEENAWCDGEVLYESDLNCLDEKLFECFCDSLSEFI